MSATVNKLRPARGARPAMTPRVLYGVLRCTACKETGYSQWLTTAPRLICHECGGDMTPEGPQVPAPQSPSFCDAMTWQLRRQQATRLAS